MDVFIVRTIKAKERILGEYRRFSYFTILFTLIINIMFLSLIGASIARVFFYHGVIPLVDALLIGITIYLILYIVGTWLIIKLTTPVLIFKNKSVHIEAYKGVRLVKSNLPIESMFSIEISEAKYGNDMIFYTKNNVEARVKYVDVVFEQRSLRNFLSLMDNFDIKIKNYVSIKEELK